MTKGLIMILAIGGFTAILLLAWGFIQLDSFIKSKRWAKHKRTDSHLAQLVADLHKAEKVLNVTTDEEIQLKEAIKKQNKDLEWLPKEEVAKRKDAIEKYKRKLFKVNKIYEHQKKECYKINNALNEYCEQNKIRRWGE